MLSFIFFLHIKISKVTVFQAGGSVYRIQEDFCSYLQHVVQDAPDGRPSITFRGALPSRLKNVTNNYLFSESETAKRIAQAKMPQKLASKLMKRSVPRKREQPKSSTNSRRNSRPGQACQGAKDPSVYDRGA